MSFFATNPTTFMIYIYFNFLILTYIILPLTLGFLKSVPSKNTSNLKSVYSLMLYKEALA